MSEIYKTIDKIPSQSVASDGTYSFCSRCSKKDNCCVRVTPSGSISHPVLFKEDVEQIEQFTGTDHTLFSVNHDILKNDIRVMKSNTNGCYFCRNGDCMIYSVRPLDCRLFPIDIMEKKDGSIVWIAYTSTCKVKFDIEACLKEAKSLLSKFKDNVHEYARAEAPWMRGETYIELGPVEIPVTYS